MYKCPQCKTTFNVHDSSLNDDTQIQCECGFRANAEWVKQSENMNKKTKVHPLLNPDSPHYELINGLESISVLESLYTKDEMMVWAKITYMKYQLRIGKKDDVQKELKKMETYKDYFNYLKDK